MADIKDIKKEAKRLLDNAYKEVQQFGHSHAIDHLKQLKALLKELKKDDLARGVDAMIVEIEGDRTYGMFALFSGIRDEIERLS